VRFEDGKTVEFEQDVPTYSVSVMEFTDGLVTHETQDPMDGEVAFGRVPATLRLDL
jgi:hypothetical protein